MPTKLAEIRQIIKSFSCKKASGFDDIPCNILEDVCESIYDALTNAVNYSFSTGIFPDSLKKAIVVLVSKNKDSKIDVIYYRLISVLPAFSKIFGKIMYNRLYSY